MLESYNLNMVYIKWQGLPEFGDQKAKVQTILDLIDLMLIEFMLVFIVYKFTEENLRLRVNREYLNEFFVKNLRFFINQLLDILVVNIFQKARYSDAEEQIIPISEF